MGRVSGKVVLITGGASGIGKETAKLLAVEGANIAIFDVNKDALNSAEEEIKNLGVRCKGYIVDVANFENVEKAIQEVVQDFGSLDMLVNNAGITRDDFLSKIEIEDWNRVISVNLTGTFNCAKAVAPIMMEKGHGNIINLSSVVGVYGNIGQTTMQQARLG